MRILWLLVILVATLLVGWQFYVVNSSAPVAAANKSLNQASSNQPTEEAAPSAAIQITETALDETLQEHQVQDGETLSSIGQKYNLKWTSIAELNGLNENSALRAGAVLKLPKTVSGHWLQTQRYSIDNTIALTTQTEISFNNLIWRLDPVEVVRRTAPTELGLSPQEPLEVSDAATAGRRVVTGRPRGFLTRFFLTQPVKTGDDGVWFLERTEQYLPASEL